MSAPLDDPFALLGLPRTFRIDPAALRSAHLRRAAAAHPDRAGRDEDESVRRSAALNEARGILAEPILRGEALLRLAGIVSEPAADAMAPAFLMEMMELREASDDAAERGDASRIAELRLDSEARRAALLAAIAADFDDGRPAALASARARLGALRAIERLVARLAELSTDDPQTRG